MAALDGRTALVTGGGGDIGSAMASELRGRGAEVTIVDLKKPAEAAPWVERASTNGTVDYVQADVGRRACIDELFADRPAYDIVVANAGIGPTSPFLELTEHDWQRTLDVNLTGVFHTAQAGARAMVRDARPGAIVLTGSWVGSVPWPDICAYSVSKAGVQMLARSMALELARHRIRVNVVAPGIVKAGLAGALMENDPAYLRRVQDIVPLGEYQTSEQVAKATAFLCSDDADHMTGATLLVDGGCSLFQFEAPGTDAA
jgi:NAD(P)-dependent dehydrogenase (short-subunit alcohol dehydrogenase family)